MRPPPAPPGLPPEAVEVEIAETWLEDVPMRGRARITLVRGRIVEEAHWAAEPAAPGSTSR